MISVSKAVGLVERWAAASHTTALENARTAAVECSRLRVKRAEVDAYLAHLAHRFAAAGDATADLLGEAEAASR